MPTASRLHRHLPTAALAAALCSCVATDGHVPVDTATALDLPAQVAATLLSEALCDELHAAPTTGAGAPLATAKGDGFTLTFERDRRGAWLAVGEHRLAVASVDARGEVALGRPPLAEADARRGFGRGRADCVELWIGAGERGVEVRLQARAALRSKLAARIRRTLQAAEDPWGSNPGAPAPQLAAWRLGALLRRADAATDDVLRATLLRRAARSPHATGPVFEQLGDLQVVAGEAQAAATNLRRAALCTRDPIARARLAQKAAAATSQAARPSVQRRRALGELAAGRLDEAEGRLHTARRTAPEPALDYQLLSALHRVRGDQMAALAAELLAREHGRDASGISAAPLAETSPRAAPPVTLDDLHAATMPDDGALRASRELYGALRAASRPHPRLPRR